MVRRIASTLRDWGVVIYYLCPRRGCGGIIHEDHLPLDIDPPEEPWERMAAEARAPPRGRAPPGGLLFDF